MEENNKESLVCAQCENDVKESDDFCPSCGELFLDDTLCENHDNVLAEGVCIICSVPFCLKCGLKVNNHFLCNDHSAYEIYQGMVRVYGTLDDLDAQYKKMFGSGRTSPTPVLSPSTQRRPKNSLSAL